MARSKIKKPKATQGYRIQDVHHNVRVPSLVPEYKGQTYVRQKFMGPGVNGPNISEHRPDQLEKLGRFLMNAAKYLRAIHREAKRARK